MIVSEVINKIMEINDILDQYNRNPEGISDIQLNTAMDCLEEYREHLMSMKVSK